MKDENFDIILVIPPKHGQESLFNQEHFEALYDYVTAFSLMTYDFSNPHRPGNRYQLNVFSAQALISFI